MKISKKNLGFSLMEVVIALGILMVVGAVAVAAAARTVNVGTYTKNRTKAQELARKQIEMLKVMRDNDYKSADNNDWNKSIDSCGEGWGFVERDPPRLDCSSSRSERINNQNFKVKIEVKKVDDDFNGDDNGNIRQGTGNPGDKNYPAGLDEKKNMRRVTIEVSWDEPFSPKEATIVKIQTYLTNDALNK